jgi:hypothetical protein
VQEAEDGTSAQSGLSKVASVPVCQSANIGMLSISGVALEALRLDLDQM